MFGKFGVWMLTNWFRMTGAVPPGSLRAIASALQPLDPLRQATSLPSIDVVVPFVVKDLPTLELCVKGVLESVRNPIGRIRLITPDYFHDRNSKQAIDRVLAELRRLLAVGQNIDVESDEQVLGPEFNGHLSARGQGQPGSWEKQQLLKLFACRNTTALATLVVDADTILLEPRAWLLSDRTQLLQFSESFQPGYKEHFRMYFTEAQPIPFSFVTHHQLMLQSTLLEMFPTSSSIVDWFVSSKTIAGPSLSEYEAYGSYVWTKHRDRVSLGAWGNLWSPKRDEVLRLVEIRQISVRDAVPDYCSISFHAHAQQQG